MTAKYAVVVLHTYGSMILDNYRLSVIRINSFKSTVIIRHWEIKKDIIV